MDPKSISKRDPTCQGPDCLYSGNGDYDDVCDQNCCRNRDGDGDGDDATIPCNANISTHLHHLSAI